MIDYPAGAHPLRHRIEFTETAARFELLDEAIENSVPDPGHDDPFFYRYQQGRPALSVRDGGRRQLRREDVAPDESILSQRRGPDQYPEPAHLADVYSKVRVYREWAFGRTSVFRGPQAADLAGDRLAEDFSNLGPELGLHPDMLPKIADLLVAASERTQLIVTTHSDLLVDAMTERPESVVVVEKHEGTTRAKRLEANDELKEYLNMYRLGDLWLRGLVGRHPDHRNPSRCGGDRLGNCYRLMRQNTPRHGFCVQPSRYTRKSGSV